MNTAIKTDTWEEIVDIGIQLAQATDRNRWAMGELAIRAERKYGDGCIGKLAYAINVRTKTLYDYHRVSAFYGQYSARAENLTWSHHREAMRLGDFGKAAWALDKCSARDWRVEKFSAILSRYLGKSKPERAEIGQSSDNEPLLNTSAVISQLQRFETGDLKGDYIFLRIGLGESVRLNAGAKVKITISAIDTD